MKTCICLLLCTLTKGVLIKNTKHIEGVLKVPRPTNTQKVAVKQKLIDQHIDQPADALDWSGLEGLDHQSDHQSMNQPADDIKPVFFSVAMGDVASSHFMRANLLTIRKLGKFKGPIVLLTNLPECVIDTLGKELLGDHSDEYGDVKVFAGPEPGMSIHIKKVPDQNETKHKALMVEEYKAAARWHAANAHLPFDVTFSKFTVIVINDDIFVGKPLDHFLETVSKTTQLATFQEMGEMKGRNLYHSGLVVIPPTPFGEECAEQWYDELRSKSGDVDAKTIDVNRTADSIIDNEDFDKEGAVQAIFAKTECAHSKKITLLNNNAEGFRFPEVRDTLHKNKVSTFMRFSNPYRIGLSKGKDGQTMLLRLYNDMLGKVDIAHMQESKNCPKLSGEASSMKSKLPPKSVVKSVVKGMALAR